MNQNLKIVTFFWVLFIYSTSLFAQVVFEVEAKQLLMPDKPIFMASSLNGWNTADNNFKFKQISDTKFQLLLPDTSTFFEYKYTQGGWDMIEADSTQKPIKKRIYTKNNESNGQIRVVKDKIEGWEKRQHYVLLLKHIPENTPEDASIYVAGNFNNWHVHDIRYKAQKLYDGSYKVDIFTQLNEIEYKFNRGDWTSAEGRIDGKARPNRKTIYSELNADNQVFVEVESWEDLFAAFNYYSLFDLVLLFSAFQGLLLSVAIPSIQDFNQRANRWLVVLLVLSSTMLLIYVVGNFRDVANALPKLILFPNLILFTYAPIFYFYIQRLLFNENESRANIIKRFIPFFIQLILLLPFFLLNGKKFQYKVVNNEQDWMIIYSVAWIFAILFNYYYWKLCQIKIHHYENKYIEETAYHQNIRYLTAVQYIHWVSIIICIFAGAVFTVQYFFNLNIFEITERSINLAWLSLALVSYLLGYFAINQPEIFKLTDSVRVEILSEVPLINKVIESNEPKLISKEEERKEENVDEQVMRIKEELQHYFELEKPYKNPNLTLNDLSNHLNTPSYLVSKAINEGFQKNFFDFVNYYRVVEFKELINQPKYKNYTLLSIAFEVGFNSKTSFNRAFKKITNQTPSEYYNSL